MTDERAAAIAAGLILDGRCSWCRQNHEGGRVVQSARGYWWHRECAHESVAEIEEALALSHD